MPSVRVYPWSSADLMHAGRCIPSAKLSLEMLAFCLATFKLRITRRLAVPLVPAASPGALSAFVLLGLGSFISCLCVSPLVRWEGGLLAVPSSSL